MAYAQLFLGNDGVSGPSGGIEYQNEKDALAWANGQIGWPYDTLIVNVYEDQEAAESGADYDHAFEIDLATGVVTAE